MTTSTKGQKKCVNQREKYVNFDCESSTVDYLKTKREVKRTTKKKKVKKQS